MTKLEVVGECYDCSGCFYKKGPNFAEGEYSRCKKYDLYCSSSWGSRFYCSYGTKWKPNSKFYTDVAIDDLKLKLKQSGFFYKFSKFIATMFETNDKTKGEKTDEI